LHSTVLQQWQEYRGEVGIHRGLKDRKRTAGPGIQHGLGGNSKDNNGVTYMSRANADVAVVAVRECAGVGCAGAPSRQCSSGTRALQGSPQGACVVMF
jgi:hypothetical protein